MGWYGVFSASPLFEECVVVVLKYIWEFLGYIVEVLCIMVFLMVFCVYVVLGFTWPLLVAAVALRYLGWI